MTPERRRTRWAGSHPTSQNIVQTHRQPIPDLERHPPRAADQRTAHWRSVTERGRVQGDGRQEFCPPAILAISLLSRKPAQATMTVGGDEKLVRLLSPRCWLF